MPLDPETPDKTVPELPRPNAAQQSTSNSARISAASGRTTRRNFLEGLRHRERRPLRLSHAGILHRDGFLYRIQHLARTHERGGAAYVYGLTAKGVDHALRNGYAASATKTHDQHSIRTLDHELEITAFHTAIHRLNAAEVLQ